CREPSVATLRLLGLHAVLPGCGSGAHRLALTAQRKPSCVPTLDRRRRVRAVARDISASERDPPRIPPGRALPAGGGPARSPSTYNASVHSLTLPPRSWIPSGVTSWK